VRYCLLLGAGLLAVAILAACGGDGDGGEGEDALEQALRQALRRMVLQTEDLPQEFVQTDELFTTNRNQASLSADPEARMGELYRWGRMLGYEVTYQPTGAASEESSVKGINVSSSLYRTEGGAVEAFAVDAVKGAEERDWTADYAGLGDFQQEKVDAGGLADEIVWLRVSGFQPVDSGPDPLITDDFIFFRVGRERGFLRVQTSSAEDENRQRMRPTVEQWLRALVRNVEEVLAEPGFEIEEE
jgi:hypothetical protein